MILLRQKEFREDELKLPKNEQEFREALKKERDKGFNAGKEKGAQEESARIFDEAKERAARKAKRAKRIEQIDEYTGLGKVKKWVRGKKEGAKNYIKTHPKQIKTGVGIALGTAAASGLAYGGAKIYKKHQDKKKSEEIRKKVRGYDTDKKKK